MLPLFLLASWGTFCLNESRFALLIPPETSVGHCPVHLFSVRELSAMTLRESRTAVSGDASWLGGRGFSSSFPTDIRAVIPKSQCCFLHSAGFTYDLYCLQN